ncbi:MAG: hypothetical protein IPP71_22295 [Bacteroidetes bacterium]|nr:hypothetical protein [Bacteroidota bacterium]
MNTTKSKLYLSAIVLAFSAIFISCKKSDSPDIPQSPGPIITAIGTPTGDITNALIDPSGGTLNSADGKLTITIPAGAVSSATNISIQTITNMAPLGLGFGYRLQPEGTTFSIPVQLTFHYDNQLLQQTAEDFLGIVTQAADRSWNALLQSSLDTNANTVTVTTTHFSDWVLGRFLDFTMTPSSSTVQKVIPYS